MNPKLTIIITLFASTLVASAMTNRPAFFIDFDKKVINVDSLRMPKSINAESLIRLLPELLERPGEDITTNYDIKINGMSLGYIYNVALEQLQLTEIEKIEVTESPISTYEKNGQGGSIDIILRDKSLYKDDQKDHFWGTASLGMLYPLDVMPHLQMNYKTPKFIIQGMMLGEYSNHTSSSTSTTDLTGTSSSKKSREQNNFVAAFMKYNPTSRDIIEVKVMESNIYTRDNETSSTIKAINNNDGTQTANISTAATNDTTTTTQLRFLTNYKHKFAPNTQLETEVVYAYNKSINDAQDATLLYDKQTIVNTFSGTLNLKHRLFQRKQHDFSTLPVYGDLKIGADYSFAWNKRDYSQKKISSVHQDILFGNGNSQYIMPYINLECRFGNFLMQAQGEYQIFGYNISMYGSQKSYYSHNDFTGSVILEQQIGKPHHLRLIYRRKIQRPSIEQVYPYNQYYISQRLIEVGNDALVPCTSNEISLDYISRYNFGQHHFTFDVNGTYNHLCDIITYNTLPSTEPTQKSNITYSKRSYFNDTKANVWSANIMAFWKYRTFSLSFTGNFYHRHSIKDDPIDGDMKSKYSNYYNLAIMPAFDLPSGWHSALYVAYHSRVSTTDQELGQCAITQLNIGKSIGRLNIYFYQKSAFTGDVTDITHNTNATDTYKNHPLILATVGIGAQYQF